MTLTFSVDWINYTALELGTRVLTHTAYPIDNASWEPIAPAKGYNVGLQNQNGCRVSWHDKRDDMGVHIQYSGSTLNKYAEAGITAHMIAIHHSLHKDRCTRIDLALDAENEGLKIGTLADETKSGVSGLRVKSYSHILSQDSGETLYLGSRQSEQFMRIYNKAAEQMREGDWIRIELECKGSRARELGNRLASESAESMATLTRGLCRNLANFEDSIWQSIVGDMAIAIAKAQAKDPDTKGWLLGSVAPAMGRYIRETQDNQVIEQFLAIVDAFIKYGKH